jgi:hypothetical protein
MYFTTIANRELKRRGIRRWPWRRSDPLSLMLGRDLAILTFSPSEGYNVSSNIWCINSMFPSKMGRYHALLLLTLRGSEQKFNARSVDCVQMTLTICSVTTEGFAHVSTSDFSEKCDRRDRSIPLSILYAEWPQQSFCRSLHSKSFCKRILIKQE